MCHLLEWPESRMLRAASSGVGVEQQEVSFHVGMQRDSASVHHSVSASYTAKKALAGVQQTLSSTLAHRRRKHPTMWAAALIHMNSSNSFYHK